MAERRMFSKIIIDSDIFLDMPQTSQNLYFHLCMRADDEGFINSPKKIMRMIGSSQVDMETLLKRRYLLVFESGVIVVKHWCMHNAIRKDRVKETAYLEEKEMIRIKENGAYTDDLNEIESNTLPDIQTGLSADAIARKEAYSNSDLPYSFAQKIRSVFEGRLCLNCGNPMNTPKGATSNNHTPSIQHNTPISKGGKHELGNISVICLQCNSSIGNDKSMDFNSLEVKKEWEILCAADGCQDAAKCPPSIGEVSIGEVSIPALKKPTKPTTKPIVNNFKKWSIEEFKNEVSEHGEEYSPDLKNAFFTYWTEPDTKGKMKFQLNKTWCTVRRLSNWYSRSVK